MNPKLIARRELLKKVGAAAVVPPRMLLPLVSPGEASTLAAQSASAVVGSTLETLTVAEAETLSAIAARLIPTDSNGPGATEARAAQYIDRALGGALAAFREAYRTGLAAIDRHAQSTQGSSFARLASADQDALLRDVERNVVGGFSDAAAFFSLVLSHTIQGTFCDPFYGGNTNFAGWDLIGYPGVRLAVTADEQGLNAHPSPTHMSAYDYRMFSQRRPARAALEPGDQAGHHGD
ncbi:MAG TPA: gluconate 2-dehydrogenase subunit 3 family protein [Vicinamibacterales bacterium]|nr:gluconate 2-dehydrogenase subunit 3 family protein [Vicinamibacterales bacterium]